MCATDINGNVSPLKTVAFVNLRPDNAPDTLAGLKGVSVGFTLNFGAGTFSLDSGNGFGSCVGNYTYTKFSPTNALLIYSNTAPPSVTSAATLNLTFTARDTAGYSTGPGEAGGSLTFTPAPSLVPATVSGKKYLLVNFNGQVSAASFGPGTLTLTNAAGAVEADTYAFQPYSRGGSLLTAVRTNLDTNLVVFTYITTNWGYYASDTYDRRGDLAASDIGEFVCPTAGPTAPAAVTGLKATLYYSGNYDALLRLGAGTYSRLVYNPDLDSDAGIYTYSRPNTMNGLLNLTLQQSILLPTLPDGTNGSETLSLNFVTPDFCFFTNVDNASNTVDCASFELTTNAIPAWPAGASLHTTNTTSTADGPVTSVITCHPNGTFNQVNSGANSVVSSGTYTRTSYGEDILFLKLSYTSPAGLAGATGYLQANFSFETNIRNIINFTYYDNAGGPPLSGLGPFAIY